MIIYHFSSAGATNQKKPHRSNSEKEKIGRRNIVGFNFVYTGSFSCETNFFFLPTLFIRKINNTQNTKLWDNIILPMLFASLSDSGRKYVWGSTNKS